jgi:4-amino-4-deoxy-L-arabinose transferase-like glycosyltransferase
VELRGFGDPGLALAVRLLAAALAAVTLIRLAVAAAVPLAPDETYYWIWSQALAPGYLDHPPMVALWIRAGTLLLGNTALGVRLLGPLSAALASCMLLDAARALFPGTRTGLIAVLLLNASLLLGVGTVIMTPDTPLLFFWTAAFWATARLAAGGSGVWWLAAGVAGGLALDSKYTALLLWAGVGLWVLLVPSIRPWLRRWQPWAACAIGLAVFAPVIDWNATHGWAGFAKQGGRIDDWQPSRAIGFLAELLGGQIGLATPLVWLLAMAGLVAAIRHAWRQRNPAWSLLLALSLPPILVFVQHAFGDRVQGNWPAIIYPALTVAAGATAMRPRWWIAAATLGFAITALAYIQAATGLLPVPPGLDPIAMRLAGWNGLADQIARLRTSAGAAFVAADGYALTSELAWSMPGAAIIGIGERWRLLDLPAADTAGKTGLLVVDPRRAGLPEPSAWADSQRIGTVERPGLGGTGAFVVYRVTLRPEIQTIALPRR